MANYTLCLQELPVVNVNHVNNIARQLAVTPKSKKEKGFKLYISSYIVIFEGEYSLISCEIRLANPFLKSCIERIQNIWSCGLLSEGAFLDQRKLQCGPDVTLIVRYK